MYIQRNQHKTRIKLNYKPYLEAKQQIPFNRYVMCNCQSPVHPNLHCISNPGNSVLRDLQIGERRKGSATLKKLKSTSNEKRKKVNSPLHYSRFSVTQHTPHRHFNFQVHKYLEQSTKHLYAINSFSQNEIIFYSVMKCLKLI